MDDRAPIFMFSLCSFDYPAWQRPNHLAFHLARVGRPVVFFVPSFRPPKLFSRLEDLGRWREWHPGIALFGERRWRRSMGEPGITVVSPPSPHWLSLEYLVRRGGWKVQLAAEFVCHVAASLRSSRPPVLWADYPYWYPLLRSVPRTALVYDCIDWWEGFLHSADAREFEEPLAREADAVVASATALAEKMSRLCDRVRLIPNGVDVPHFVEARKPGLPLRVMASIPKPIIGYYGSYGGLSEQFDADLVAEVARRRPDWSFVIIGPRYGAWPAGKALQNVYELGPRPYEELPAYLAHFDVAMIPFSRGKLTEAASPLKLFEFLAAGKPVVSTPIREILALGDVVEVAGDPEGFETAIERALTQTEPEQIRRRIEVAEGNSWDARFAEADRLLVELES